MRIGCKTGGPGDGVSYWGSHGQTVRVGRSARNTVQQETFEGENREFRGFVAVRESFLREIWVWHPLAWHKRAIRESFLRENFTSSSPSKVSRYTVLTHNVRDSDKPKSLACTCIELQHLGLWMYRLINNTSHPAVGSLSLYLCLLSWLMLYLLRRTTKASLSLHRPPAHTTYKYTQVTILENRESWKVCYM